MKCLTYIGVVIFLFWVYAEYRIHCLVFQCGSFF